MQQVPGEVELADPDQPEYFDVEKILTVEMDFQDQTATREFLVLWKGYPIEDAEWIPSTYFSDQEALRDDIVANRIPEDK